MTIPANWNDVLVRDNYPDAGRIPSRGFVWESPDIIPFGSDVLSFDLLESSYNGSPDISLNHPVVQGQINRIYVRGKNLRTGCPSSGRVRLWYAPGGLLLNPQAWTPLSAEGNGTVVPLTVRGGSREIPPGAICVSESAFLWPTNLPAGHYCLLATVDTPAHPMGDKLPPFSSLGDAYEWVADNPNVCWHNIEVVPCQRTQYVCENLTIGNLGDTSASFAFGISGKNLPSGTVTFTNSDQQAPFSLTAQIDPPGTNVGFTHSVSLPAHYSGTVTAVIRFDQPLPCGARFRLRFFEMNDDDTGDAERQNAVRLTGALASTEQQDLLQELGGFTFVAMDLPVAR
jgi:hypothetical protein